MYPLVLFIICYLIIVPRTSVTTLNLSSLGVQRFNSHYLSVSFGEPIHEGMGPHQVLLVIGNRSKI